ncbi:MAG: hypothetical protein ACRYG4_04235 [Janthinobacterium lividum]
MPIRPEQKWYYPIDWPQLSAVVRFDRAKGRCERCRRPHGRRVFHLGDGRWFDVDLDSWRDGRGRLLRRLPPPGQLVFPQGRLVDLAGETPIPMTRVFVSCAHLDHDPGNNAPRNLAALCQRCHLEHDRPEHQRVRWWTMFLRRARGDLFNGEYR